MFKTIFSALLVSIIIAAGVVGYRGMYQDPVTPIPTSSSASGVVAVGGTGTGSANSDYTALLEAFKQITLNDAVLRDPAIATLVPYDFPIPDLKPGRVNPFAP